MCASAVSTLRHVTFAVFFGLVAIDASLAGARAQSDPLPSWNEGAVDKFDKALDEAKAKGWTLVDMKQDWKAIFSSEK